MHSYNANNDNFLLSSLSIKDIFLASFTLNAVNKTFFLLKGSVVSNFGCESLNKFKISIIIPKNL
jgi:hypothetical protein